MWNNSIKVEGLKSAVGSFSYRTEYYKDEHGYDQKQVSFGIELKRGRWMKICTNEVLQDLIETSDDEIEKDRCDRTKFVNIFVAFVWFWVPGSGFS